jgi:hypothetical protein
MYLKFKQLYLMLNSILLPKGAISGARALLLKLTGWSWCGELRSSLLRGGHHLWPYSGSIDSPGPERPLRGSPTLPNIPHNRLKYLIFPYKILHKIMDVIRSKQYYARISSVFLAPIPTISRRLSMGMD